MMAFVMLSLVSPAAPDVTVHEPRSASPWVNRVEASCGGTELVVSGHGGGGPLDSRPRLLVSGQKLRGSAAARLLGDLDHKRAVYRLQILCARSGRIDIRISLGEKQMDGSVRYQAAAGSISNGRLETYTGLEEVDAETFWFR